MQITKYYNNNNVIFKVNRNQTNKQFDYQIIFIIGRTLRKFHETIRMNAIALNLGEAANDFGNFVGSAFN